MLLGIQILGVLFAIFMMYLTFIHQKRKEFTLKEYSFWTLLWVMFIVITIFPGIFDPFVKVLSLQRTMDFLVILGILFMTGMLFNNYLVLKNTNKKVEDVVRSIAINKTSKK